MMQNGWTLVKLGKARIDNSVANLTINSIVRCEITTYVLELGNNFQFLTLNDKVHMVNFLTYIPSYDQHHCLTRADCYWS